MVSFQTDQAEVKEMLRIIWQERQAEKAEDRARKRRKYRENPPASRLKGRERKARIARMKAEKGCALCDEREACALVFHHRDPDEKDCTIASMGPSVPWSDVLAEISKCVVLCCNCHAKVHAGLLVLSPSL